jgi:DNA-binding transcriptional regulator YiaG
VLERGSLEHWHRLVAAIRADPWGPVARHVAEALRHSRPYGVAAVMERALERARTDAEAAERAEVAAEIARLVERSGLSRSGFAERIGTSASCLSTYLAGKVTPAATLLVRMRKVADSRGG